MATRKVLLYRATHSITKSYDDNYSYDNDPIVLKLAEYIEEISEEDFKLLMNRRWDTNVQILEIRPAPQNISGEKTEDAIGTVDFYLGKIREKEAARQKSINATVKDREKKAKERKRKQLERLKKEFGE